MFRTLSLLDEVFAPSSVEDWYKTGGNKGHWRDGYHHAMSGQAPDKSRKGHAQQAYYKGYWLGSLARQERSRRESIGRTQMSVAMLLTPAKKIVKESIQNIKEAATMADAIAAFHGAGCSSAVGVPNGKDVNSYVITCTGMPAGDFQKMQHSIDAALKERGFRLVSVSYHEDPATGQTTHTCVVKSPVTI